MPRYLAISSFLVCLKCLSSQVSCLSVRTIGANLFSGGFMADYFLCLFLLFSFLRHPQEYVDPWITLFAVTTYSVPQSHLTFHLELPQSSAPAYFKNVRRRIFCPVRSLKLPGCFMLKDLIVVSVMSFEICSHQSNRYLRFLRF